MPNTTPWLNRLSALGSRIDAVIELCGRACSWLVLLMVLLVSYDVTMRYVFQSGSVALQELEWHLFSLLFLLGAGYALKHDGHVRLDLFYQGRFMNDRRRAWVNLLGSLVILVPFCALIINSSHAFVLQAWQFNEGSPDPGGLPYRWLLKSAIPIGFALLLLQGLSEAIKNLRVLLGNES
ncbi:MAG: TRAP transporter small permease subunit [Thiotrichales bacterium]|nr:TRAP transporter small permease subunit [Thiotrichales bacterium]